MESYEFNNLKNEIKEEVNTNFKYIYKKISLKKKIKEELKKELTNTLTDIFLDDDIDLKNLIDYDNFKKEIINELCIELVKSNLTIYKEETNIKLLNNINLSQNKNINVFDFDIKFIKNSYKNLSQYTYDEIITFVKNNSYIGYVFHPKQLRNIFGDEIKFYISKKELIYIEYLGEYYNLYTFINKINSYSFDNLKDLTIRQYRMENFIDNRLLLLIYIGNMELVVDILNKITDYKKKTKNFSICFCVNYRILDRFLPYLKLFIITNYIIYCTNELGTDITPSLLAYNEIIKKYNFQYIIKIHTKKDKRIFNKATDYLLSMNLDELLLKKNTNCSSIGYRYINNKQDNYNKILMYKFSNILEKTEFVPCTFFLTTKETFDKVLTFFKNNYKEIFLQNMYDNNTLNCDFSYVHFIERLFGYV